MSNHVLRVRALTGPAYVRHVFVPEGSFGPIDFWLTYDMLLDPLLLGRLLRTDQKNNVSHSFVSTDGGADASSINLSVGRDLYDLGLWFDPTFATTENAGSVPAPSLGWHTVEMHFHATQRYTFYIDGVAVWDEVGDAFTNRGGITALILGLSLLSGTFDSPIAYYDNVKIGTSRGASDYFSDNFESGLGKWVLRGDVEIVVGPVTPTDSGVTVTDSITRRSIGRSVTDTGLAITDEVATSAIARHLTDSGLTVTDTAVGRLIHGISATGLTITDSVKKTAKHFISDTALTILLTLVVRKNGHGTSVRIEERGLRVTDSIAPNFVFHKSIPTYAPETGLTITDGVRISTFPPQPPMKPHADFTWLAALLVVSFTDTSTPGSDPITTWAWTFGDGATSTATNPTHTYAGTGTYFVGLTVTTVDGSSSVVKPVAVSSVAPPGTHIDGVIF